MYNMFRLFAKSLGGVMMRKLLSLILVLLLVSVVAVGCGQSSDPAEAPASDAGSPSDATDDNAAGDATDDNTSADADNDSDANAADDNNADSQTAGQYIDGTYTAEQADYDAETGWKENITITVENGAITAVDWNGTSEATDKDKKTYSADGEYKMVEYGNAIAEWDVQAKAVEDYLIETQDPNAIPLDAEGHTDAISGATIHVSSFVTLANEALANAKAGSDDSASAETGKYVDGTFTAEDADYDAETGWKENITITVENGAITAVDWNGTSEATDKDKKTYSADGEYKMVEYGNAIAEWDVQAKAVEDYLIQTQDPNAIPLDAEGHTDAISGATIHVSNFVKLANEALQLK